MVRPKWYACTTMVVQRDGSFEVKGNHNHIGKVGAAVAVKILKDVKASTIVWEVTGPVGEIDQCTLSYPTKT
ncbi:unnamed protein product [Pocillopora meandrina]|uniref:Uncharacterized protein n=1 Tax=Pocillopora meandrina TaxID=46732 RepID=A0AAU9X0J5_9CNID|nr:unnamed protein product [Pocillopora meandrina]